MLLVAVGVGMLHAGLSWAGNISGRLYSIFSIGVMAIMYLVSLRLQTRWSTATFLSIQPDMKKKTPISRTAEPPLHVR